MNHINSSSNSNHDGDNRIDAIAGPADLTRPRNPWPRLFLAALAITLLLILFGMCSVKFLSAPDPVVRVPADEVQLDLPRLLPIVSFGADSSGSTYGIWILITSDELFGLISYGESGCHIDWNRIANTFQDPCTNNAYSPHGLAITEDAQRHMHRVKVTYDASILGRYIVDLSTIELSVCLSGATVSCARGPDEIFIEMPNRPIATALN
ncbi:MAG TPA: hypothetical protein EYQ00_14950 [Dehalococcoidia bacterium]|jgi:hypothetical protein|nr:hypothetical protein [Dehalococcoidia bacterium]